jgi:hypothetical protein
MVGDAWCAALTVARRDAGSAGRFDESKCRDVVV